MAFFALVGSVSALSTFLTVQGGTGTTTPSGILYGDNGASSHLNTVTIGSGCTFVAGTLSCPGTSSGFSYPFTPTSHYGVNTSATGTPIFDTAGLMASTTSYFDNSTTTFATILKNLWLSNLSAGELGIDANHLVYSGATTTAGTGLTYSGNAFNVNTSQNITTLSNLTNNGFVTTSGGVGTLGVQQFPVTVSQGGTGQTSFTAGNLIYGDGTGGLSNVATSSETCSSPLSCTSFNVVGSGGGAITLGTVAVANGGTNSTSFAPNSLISSNGAGTSLSATSSNPLYVGALIATSTTVSSNFNDSVGIASSTPTARLSVGSGIASSSIIVAEYDYGAPGNNATSTSATLSPLTSNNIEWPLGTAATTLTLCNFYPGAHLIVRVSNPNSTAGALTWAVCAGEQLYWVNNTVPTQTTTANQWDIWSFTSSAATTNATSTPTIVISGAQTPGF